MEYVPKALCYIDGLCKEDVTLVRVSNGVASFLHKPIDMI